MRVQTVKISPKRAAAWLEKSGARTQRSLSQRRVEKIAHAISEGQWRMTHQAIALNAKEEVLDGQHRLHAIVRAGRTVEALVAFDTPDETFEVIDSGAARSTADAVKIAGYSSPNVAAATVRSLLTYNQIAGTTDEWRVAHGRTTTTDVLDYLAGPDGDLVYAALQRGARVANSLSRYGLTTALSTSALILMTHPTAIGESSQAEFWERLSDGVMLDSYSPILAMRRWCVADTGYHRIANRDRRQVTIAIALKSINDWALHRERSLVSWKAGIEPMPVPLPPGTDLTHPEVSEVREAELARLEAEDDVPPPKSTRKRPTQQAG